MVFDPNLFPQGSFSPVSSHSTVRILPGSGIPIGGVSAANDQTSIGAIKEPQLCGCPPSNEQSKKEASCRNMKAAAGGCLYVKKRSQANAAVY